MLHPESTAGGRNVRRAILSGTLLGVSLVLAVIAERDARACGGCFVPPPPPGQNVDSQITGERMIFSISTLQSTLYDEITYSGTPGSFAWVLPIKGKADVGLSADLLFATLDQATSSTVLQPPTNCPPPPTCNYGNFGAGTAGPDIAADAGARVSVLSQAQVGPYETVQLSSTDGSALTNWLTSNGYNIPASDQPALDHYVFEGMDFLALKLVPGAGVNAMQPVRVTVPGAYPVLPLRMVSVGTGSTTSITLWIVADGRWEPMNFPFFTITNAELTWDWNTNSSNFEQLRTSKAAAYHGAGWLIESSIDLAQYTLSQSVEQAQQSLQYSPTPVGGYTLPTSGAGSADAGTEGGSGEVSAEGGNSGSDDDEAALLAAAEADVAVLFTGIKGSNARITRMRGDIGHSALTNDLDIQASANTGEISNIYNPANQIGQPLCPVYNSTCQQTGEAPRDVAQAQAAGNGGCSTTASSSLRSGWTIGALSAWLGLLGLRACRRRERRG
jgi:hypothetical protein